MSMTLILAPPIRPPSQPQANSHEDCG
uniref:Uncharacterized protein n=1 Tax=Arundo donax TaxID=35708 RepID=A0A0A9HBX0_ARUDO